MLRQNEATGEVVSLPFACSAANARCYVDECVAPGHYRYGFAEPEVCCSECGGGTEYYEMADVTSPLGNCQRTVADAGTMDAGAAPWDGGQLVCPLTGVCVDPGTPPPSDAGTRDASDAAPSPENASSASTGGCAMTTGLAMSRSASSVAMIAALALLGMRRRRERGRR